MTSISSHRRAEDIVDLMLFLIHWGQSDTSGEFAETRHEMLVSRIAFAIERHAKQMVENPDEPLVVR